jgi:hypothetical protein
MNYRFFSIFVLRLVIDILKISKWYYLPYINSRFNVFHYVRSWLAEYQKAASN